MHLDENGNLVLTVCADKQLETLMLNPQPYGWEENGDIETEWLEPKFREDMQSLAAQMRAGTVSLVVKHEFATEGHLRRWVATKYLLHDWLVYEAKEANTPHQARPNRCRHQKTAGHSLLPRTGLHA